MSRWLPAVAIGLALGATALVAGVALVGEGERTPAERSAALAAELRCPDCQGLSVVDSPTASAVEIRRQIDELVAGGATDDEIRGHFVERYGEWILLAPTAPFTWVLPYVVVLGGGAALFGWLRSRAGSAVAPATTAGVDPPERRRLRDEVEAIDA
jgi:cytochrome c-type biogenesis protein CcmH